MSTTTQAESQQINGLLALEISGGRAPARAALTQHEAGELAARMARDLTQLVPEASALDLVLFAAHFDPAEALRPGWSLHRRLHELQQRAPGRDEGPRLIAFGAGADGDVPMPLQSDPDLVGGALRVLPFQLIGPAEIVARVAEACENVLLERGMAQADTALLAQQGFGAEIEHARYLTLHDLAAMTALQYENQGLAPVWPVIETALLAPAEELWLDAPPEPLLRYAEGEVRIALLDAAAWQTRNTPATEDRERLARQYDYFLARQRQLAAVLEAHGIPVTFAHCPSGDDLCRHLSA
ncbi:MAG: hypothetical protein ABW178_12785 [Pseudoxanthomonas sp.]